MEEVLKKCLSCKADVITGQRFCSNCGAGQELQMRSKEEIREMIKRIDEILDLRKQDRGGKDSIGIMMSIMLTHIVSETCLKWVLGLTDDKNLLGLFEIAAKPIERGEK